MDSIKIYSSSFNVLKKMFAVKICIEDKIQLIVNFEENSVFICNNNQTNNMRGNNNSLI